jgi:YbgC/YbaW family acyl-CoA thioester hydrolase
MKAFETRLTVRGYELDSYGHVNNAVYVQYLEQGRWEAMQKLDILDYFTQNGLMMVVIETSIRYMREACLFDELVVETTYEKKAPFLLFRQRIRDASTGLPNARATVKTLLIDRNKIPQDLPEILFQHQQK